MSVLICPKAEANPQTLSWPLSTVEQLAPNNSPCYLPFLNNGPCPLPILNNRLHPLPFFNNSPHLLPLSNSNLHCFPTNSLRSLPDNSLCHFPYSWKPSLIMWMLLDQMMRGFLPQCKHALTNGSVLMGLSTVKSKCVLISSTVGGFCL